MGWWKEMFRLQKIYKVRTFNLTKYISYYTNINTQNRFKSKRKRKHSTLPDEKHVPIVLYPVKVLHAIINVPENFNQEPIIYYIIQLQ